MDIRARITVDDMVVVTVDFLARRQSAAPMAGRGSERTIVGRVPAEIVVQAPAVSIGRMEGAGTTLTVIGSGGAQRPRRAQRTAQAEVDGYVDGLDLTNEKS